MEKKTQEKPISLCSPTSDPVNDIADVGGISVVTGS